jgi:DNA-binding response OmpR family regulator
VNTIVVVDDDEVFSNLIRTVLELEGYQAVVVPRLADVVPTVRQTKPALLLMDVHVSHGDTLHVLQELRADEAFKAIPVLMTSGMDLGDECLAAGATSFILKPFRPSEVLAIIADLVNRKDTCV